MYATEEVRLTQRRQLLSGFSLRAHTALASERHSQQNSIRMHVVKYNIVQYVLYTIMYEKVY